MNLDRRTRGNPKTAELAESEVEPLEFEAPISNSEFAKQLATTKEEPEVQQPAAAPQAVAAETAEATETVGAAPKAAVVEPKASETAAPTTAVVEPKASETAAPTTAVVEPKATETAAPTTAVVEPKASETVGAAPTTAAPKATETAAPANDTPAWAQKPHVSRTLKEGAEGDDVKSLQKALGIPESGTFDAATKKAVEDFQAKKGLGKKPDGIAGPQTLNALGLRVAFRSAYHKDDAFIPTYRVTAEAESDIYRTKDDPYAVGAITNPRQEDDDGGKTYGTYQFESYVYRDGTQKSKGAVSGSTLMRFIQWEGNPYGPELQKVVTAHGVASAEFDAKWKELTTKDNKAFGKAQEAFLEHDVAGDVASFFDRAGASQAARADADLYDVAIGTRNQYGSLTNGMADAVAAKQAEAKKKSNQDFSAAEFGRALQDDKESKVATQFKSSPKAQPGIHDRIARERKLFQ